MTADFEHDVGDAGGIGRRRSERRDRSRISTCKPLCRAARRIGALPHPSTRRTARDREAACAGRLQQHDSARRPRSRSRSASAWEPAASGATWSRKRAPAGDDLGAARRVVCRRRARAPRRRGSHRCRTARRTGCPSARSRRSAAKRALSSGTTSCGPAMRAISASTSRRCRSVNGRRLRHAGSRSRAGTRLRRAVRRLPRRSRTAVDLRLQRVTLRNSVAILLGVRSGGCRPARRQNRSALDARTGQRFDPRRRPPAVPRPTVQPCPDMHRRPPCRHPGPSFHLFYTVTNERCTCAACSLSPGGRARRHRLLYFTGSLFWISARRRASNRARSRPKSVVREQRAGAGGLAGDGLGRHRLSPQPNWFIVLCCAAGLERGFAGEVFLVVVADVGARHVLVLHAGDALADFRRCTPLT